MINIFDPKQETLEEYLRRIHTNDKLEKTEWNYGEEEEKKKRSDIS
jgi:hypothetical protein